MLAAIKQQFSVRQTFRTGVLIMYQHLVNMFKVSYLHVKVYLLWITDEQSVLEGRKDLNLYTNRCYQHGNKVISLFYVSIGSVCDSLFGVRDLQSMFCLSHVFSSLRSI